MPCSGKIGIDVRDNAADILIVVSVTMHKNKKRTSKPCKLVPTAKWSIKFDESVVVISVQPYMSRVLRERETPASSENHPF